MGSPTIEGVAFACFCPLSGGLKALAHQQPLALSFVQREGFRRGELGRLLIGRINIPEQNAPVPDKRACPAALFGRHSDTRTQLRHARLNRRAWGRSRVRAALLPVGQELRFRLFYAGRAPARRDAELWIDVDRDRPKPPQLRPAMPIFIHAADGAAVLEHDVIEPIPIGGR
jgi:hypothetical protein